MFPINYIGSQSIYFSNKMCIILILVIENTIHEPWDFSIGHKTLLGS